VYKIQNFPGHTTSLKYIPAMMIAVNFRSSRICVWEEVQRIPLRATGLPQLRSPPHLLLQSSSFTGWISKSSLNLIRIGNRFFSHCIYILCTASHESANQVLWRQYHIGPKIKHIQTTGHAANMRWIQSNA